MPMRTSLALIVALVGGSAFAHHSGAMFDRFKKSAKKWESVPGFYCDYDPAEAAK